MNNRDWLDTLSSSGAMEGPFRRTRPVTITRFMRARRWLRSVLRDAVSRFAARWL